MRDFKVGDKVICIDNSGLTGTLVIGKEYTITEINYEYVHLAGFGIASGFYHPRFINKVEAEFNNILKDILK